MRGRIGSRSLVGNDVHPTCLFIGMIELSGPMRGHQNGARKRLVAVVDGVQHVWVVVYVSVAVNAFKMERD